MMILLAVTAASGSEVKIDGYRFVAASGHIEVSQHDKGSFDLCFYPGDKEWLNLDIHLPAENMPAGAIKFTVQQIHPQGITPGKTAVQFKPKGAGEQHSLQELLQDNKAHTLRVKLNTEPAFKFMTVWAHKPQEKIVLRFSGLETDNPPSSAGKKPLPPAKFKGKPFFPLGGWDMRDPGRGRYSVDPGFLAAGGNMAVMGELAMPGDKYYETGGQPVIYPGLEHSLNDPMYKDIAIIIGLGNGLVLEEAKELKGYAPLLDPEKQHRHRAMLEEDLKKLRKYPNVIGYMLDEPENAMWEYYNKHFPDEWQKEKDRSLSKRMEEWFGWANEMIRQEHPEAKLMPVLGWWTTYHNAGSMYDILVANEYPLGPLTNQEFQGPLYQANYDAGKAVDAARQKGGDATVIYMPPMFDNCASFNIKTPTLREQRYLCFTPLTRGAMGIFGWRLGRASAEYRNKVIYPVMREIHELVPYFMGSWHDELVSSDHDTATVDYLQKFAERVRLVQDKEDGEMIQVKDGVPDISYCLRQNPADGSYLLLATNNRREPVTVKFTLKLKNPPPVLIDFLDRHQVRLQGNTFSDTFEPFGVHAYMIEPIK